MIRKIILIGIIFFNIQFLYAQWNFGLEVSPAFQLQTIRSKNTGIWSSNSGYGFQFGLTAKNETSNSTYYATGIKYEYTAFDNRVNNFLVSSLRMNSINVPFSFHHNIMQDIFFNYGAGLNYYFINTTLSGGLKFNTNSEINQIQPYLSLGANMLIDKFDLGVQGRYHLFNLYIKEIQDVSNNSTRILSLDLMLKYYF